MCSFTVAGICDTELVENTTVKQMTAPTKVTINGPRRRVGGFG